MKLYSPEYLIKLLEEKARLHVGWSEEDEMDFIVTTVELRRDLRHFITKTIKSNEKEQLAGILLDDDDDDLVESRDDLVFGIDDISLFDLDDPFVYTQKDKFFFYLLY